MTHVHNSDLSPYSNFDLPNHNSASILSRFPVTLVQGTEGTLAAGGDTILSLGGRRGHEEADAGG